MTSPILKAPQPYNLLLNLVAGLISGLVGLTYSLSFSALIFSGSLSSYLPFGINSALISSTLLAIGVACGSSFPFAIAGPDSNATALLAVMAMSITTQLTAQNSPSAILPTVGAAIALSTILASIFLFSLGRLGLGQFARFIPYPVVGGFLAGTGWLIFQGSFTVMVGMPLTIENLPRFLQANAVTYWLPGLSFALLLRLILSLYKHSLVMPLLLLAAMALTHLLLWLTNTPLDRARLQGWLFAIPDGRLDQTWSFSLLQQVDWSVLLGQSSSFVTMMGVIVIVILLNATGIEISTQSDANLNRELQASGIANLFTGLCGGMVGYLSLNRTLLNYRAGANERLSGIVTGIFCGSVLFLGTAVVSYIPKPVLGGLLLHIGLNALIEWIYNAWFKLLLLDYALVIIILLIVASSGFLQGVSIGLVVACLLFAFNYSRTQTIRYTLFGDRRPSNFERSFQQQKSLRQEGDQVYIICLQGYVFFGTANTILNHVRQRLSETNSPIHFLVLDFHLVSGLDSSAVFSFVKLRQLAQKHELHLIFTHLQLGVQQQLLQNGCIQTPDEVCRIFPDLDRGIEWCEDQILRALPLRRRKSLPLVLQFGDLLSIKKEEVHHFMHYLEPLQFATGQTLFHRGDSSDCLYFVEYGQVSILLELDNGQTKRLRTLTSGTIFGEMDFYRNYPRSAGAVTDEASKLYRLSREALQKMQTQNPQLAAAFHQFVVGLLAERLTQTTRELETYF